MKAPQYEFEIKDFGSLEDKAISMYHYVDTEEMQFDIRSMKDYRKLVVINISLQDAEALRDRLNYFIEFHK